MLEIQYLAWMGKSIIYIKREREKERERERERDNLMDRDEVRLSLSQTRKKTRRICGLLQSNARHAIDIRRPRLLFVYSLNYSSRPIVFIRELYVTILYIHILHTFVHAFIHIYIHKLEIEINDIVMFCFTLLIYSRVCGFYIYITCYLKAAAPLLTAL